VLRNAFVVALAVHSCTCVAAVAQVPSDDSEDDDAPALEAPRHRWGLEAKRQATSRGTPSETTKTSFKFEHYPDGAIALLRLEVPFPDDKSDFAGSPLDPRLGDIKMRVGWRALSVAQVPWSPYAEITLPTANPSSLGSGKVQITAGIQTLVPWPAAAAWPLMNRPFFSALAEQVFSVAGDGGRQNIHYTKLELGIRDSWRQTYSLKLTFKPVIDWQQDGRTGAVAELEGGASAGADWRVSLMIGSLLWGEGVPSTYSKRVELKANRKF
jgi:hypothetical protein